MRQLFRSKEAGILLIIILVSAVITLKNPVFLTTENLLDLAKNNTVIGIVALGMLPVIITGGIDVSVGAMTAAVTIIIGKFMVNFGGNLLLVFILGCASGALLGAFNGLLVSRLELPPIVVTLGSMSIINGLMLYYTGGSWITNIPQWFIDFGRIKLAGIPIQVFFLVLAAVITYLVLKYTLIGRGIFAIGGNPVAAVRAGFHKDKILLFLYSYLGFLVGLAAVVHTSIMRQVDPNAFSGFEMNVIAAVVLGGANVLGGEGSVFGTILGVTVLAVIQNGLILAWIPTYWQQIVVGVIILAAVCFDVIQNRRRQARIARIDVAGETPVGR
ncbi:MAG: ABC transporter permease [Firmicutes bacterium]|jgi:simple sugar transport system permease protein/ribose transport system permease protein|nr:ABC transporter permease [Bacillota bacterium]